MHEAGSATPLRFAQNDSKDGARWSLRLQTGFSSALSHPHFKRRGLTPLKIVGILLIVAGVAALAYGGFTYTTRKKAVDMGPIQIDKTQHHSVPVPPILGLVAIAGGGALVYFGARQGR
jgi:hypothetical protein